MPSLGHDAPVTVEQDARARTVPAFDRLMLTSLVAVGGCWLLVLAPPWGTAGPGDLILFSVGAGYVVVGAMAMAGLYARERITLAQEVSVLVLLWLAAVALWTAIYLALGVTAERDPGTAYLVNGVSVPWSIYFALWVATPAYLAWQVPALVIRIAWRRRPARLRGSLNRAGRDIRGS